jgi:NAD(P)-dependent dehydrogenase (short-subunit alcohol dehydrogenase family)
MDDTSFEGRVAIVTGAGNGLGKDYALGLARRGASLVVNDLGGGPLGGGASHEAADAVVEEIRSAGGNAVASYHSVADPKGGAAIAQTALDAFGKIDILLNNAGIIRTGLFENLKIEDLDDLLATHLYGSVHVTKSCYAAMKKNRYGRIVFTCSSAGVYGMGGFCAYSTAKAGLIGLMKVVAIEGARHGICSNILLPGALGSRMIAASTGSAATREGATNESSDTDEVHEMMEMARILEKAMRPEFVTPLALYLCGEECTISNAMMAAYGGIYSEVFIGATLGWVASDKAPPTVREIRAHIDEIRDRAGYVVPSDSIDDIKRAVALRRQLTR